jgi:protein-tyrosine-phosphatase
MRYAFALLALGIALQFARPVQASEMTANKTILFVCLHGSVNSQVAAAHFNRIAGERGLPYSAIARGIDANNSIPTRIRDNLNLDGLAPLNDVPQPLQPSEAARADKVIAFDAVPDERRGMAEVIDWSDVPLALKDYAASREAIVHHIDDLVRENLQSKE